MDMTIPSEPYQVYDALVLGGGPAGLSVALGLSRVHRTCALFSDKRNTGVHAAHSILTLDGESPENIVAIGRKQIKDKYRTADFIDATRIVRVNRKQEKNNEEFEVQDEQGKKWKGRTLVLATGSRDLFPELEGFKENWPENIYQCLFCNGHERSHLPKGILAFPLDLIYLRKMASMAKYQSTNNSRVTIFTNGQSLTNDITETIKALDMIVESRKIVKLIPSLKPEGVIVVFDDGDQIYMGFLVSKPDTIPAEEQLITDLGVEMILTPLGKIVKRVEPFGETNIPGVFVCGDAGTPFKLIVGAMASGTFTAAGVAYLLNEKDDEMLMKTYEESNMSKTDSEV